MKKKIAVFLMVSGIVFIIAAALLFCYNNYENQRAHKASEELMKTLRTQIEAAEIESDAGEDFFDEEMKTKVIDGYEYIGYLSLPDLNIDLPIMSQWDYKRLKISPCRYFGSVKTNNLVIAAHNYRWHFGYLGHLEEGDLIIFTDMDSKKYSYNVSSVEILLPTDVEKVKNSSDDLILYTCTYGGEKRIAVRCKLKNK